MRKRNRPPSTGVSREAWGRVHPLLDLHGLTGDEARRRTDRWLRDHQSQGVRTVIVVTGRGLHSQGLPVVRGEVEHLLTELKGGIVSRWEDTHYGGGFRVELRSPPREHKPFPPPRPPHERAEVEPDLLLLAHEALWDLGIAPTPALLDAELRRLRRERGQEE